MGTRTHLKIVILSVGFSLSCTKVYQGGLCPDGSIGNQAGIQSLEQRKALISGKVGAITPDQMNRWLAQFNLQVDHVSGQLIVRFKDETSANRITTVIHEVGGTNSAKLTSSNTVLMEFSNAIANNRKQLLEKALLLQTYYDDITFVESNALISKAQFPNDPNFVSQYALHNTGLTGGTIDADIDAPEAWDLTTGSTAVVVGILDSGVDYTHPDLAPNYWNNPGEVGLDSSGAEKKSNNKDDDQNGFVDDWRGWDFVQFDNDPMDEEGHGTHVAGIIGAVGNNATGVTGVNWNVSLYGIRFLDARGAGNLFDAARAIDYATEMNLPITNNSWGSSVPLKAIQEAIQRAKARGILFVASAGNGGLDGKGDDNDTVPAFPASFPEENIISVAATDHNDLLAEFSNFGFKSVHLAAPGVGILSTVSKNTYDYKAGTSMAAPHVTGVAALIKAKYPISSYAEIKVRLLSNVDTLPSLINKVMSSGRLNAFRALEEDTILPGTISNPQVIREGISSIDLQFDPAGDDGTMGNAASYVVKFATSPIMEENGWTSAKYPKFRFLTSTSASPVQMRVWGLPISSAGFAAIRAIDNVGNIGPISSPISFTTSEAFSFYQNNADSNSQISLGSIWTSEFNFERGGKVFSDSVGRYENFTSAILELPVITASNPDLFLSFLTRMDGESLYDAGFVEISTDGGMNWKEIVKYSGRGCPWHSPSIELYDFVDSKNTAKLRFRFETDGDTNSDGWLIDDIQLKGPNVTRSFGLPQPEIYVVGTPNNPTSLSRVEATAFSQTAIEYDATVTSEVGPITCDGRFSDSFIPITTPIGINMVGFGPQRFCIKGRDAAGRTTFALPYDFNRQKNPIATITEAPNLFGNELATLKISGASGATKFNYRVDDGNKDCPRTDYSGTNPLPAVLYLGFQTEGRKTVCIRGLDEAGNQQMNPSRTSWIVDRSPPVFINFKAVTVESSLAISWDTDEQTLSEIKYGIGKLDQKISQNTLRTQHTFVLPDLIPGGNYSIEARQTDRASNSTSYGPFQMLIGVTPDTTPPQISNFHLTPVTQTSVKLDWTTDEAAKSSVHWGPNAETLTNTVNIPTLQRDHSVTIGGLKKDSTYYFLILVQDTIGNSNEFPLQSFSTGSAPVSRSIKNSNVNGKSTCAATHYPNLGSLDNIVSWGCSWIILIVHLSLIWVLRITFKPFAIIFKQVLRWYHYK